MPNNALPVVHSNFGAADPRCELDAIPPDATTVHVDGYPFRWVVDEVRQRAPGVHTIRVTPATLARAVSAVAYYHAQGVALVAGYARTRGGGAWTKGSPQYTEYQARLHALRGKRRDAFEEMVLLGVREAHITRRYFCLGGEAYASQAGVAREFGFAPANNFSVSTAVVAVLFLLELVPTASKRARRRAAFIQRILPRLRVEAAKIEARRALVAELGLGRINKGLPHAEIHALRAVVEAQRTGALEALSVTNKRAHKAIVLRYGLDVGCRAYRTLRGVGAMLHVTHQRVAQLLEQGFRVLGISRD